MLGLSPHYLLQYKMAEIDMAAVEALHVALQQSFSPDSRVREPAEAAIKNLKNVPGATQMLLHITEEKQVSRDLFDSIF